MRHRWWMPLALGGAMVALLRAPAAGVAYSDRPPVAHSGGFGEPTCHACHFDQPPGDAAGSLTLEGAPGEYVAGERYPLTLRLTRADMVRGGFQLTARFAEGERAGEQAGTLRPLDERAGVIEEEGVQYASHLAAGTVLDAPGEARWTLEWTAPEGGDPVVFHLAANAANGDDSEFGDFIYADSLRAELRK